MWVLRRDQLRTTTLLNYCYKEKNMALNNCSGDVRTVYFTQYIVLKRFDDSFIGQPTEN